MNCKDFREIADSYLSDELAVETNHEVFQHLENCADCRQELSMRREVREKLRLSLKNSTDFQMNPAFAVKLKANLKEQAFHQTSWFSWKILTPVLVTLLLITGLSFALFYRPNLGPNSNLFADFSEKALNRHEECGLKHFTQWLENINKVKAEKVTFVKSLQDDETHILSGHECPVGGKRFTHYLLERHGKLISVLKTASENVNPANPNEEDSILCKKEHGLQVSSFKIGDELIFVISDMSESENLGIARQLSDSVRDQVDVRFGNSDLGLVKR
jgi:hypothetical protein